MNVTHQPARHRRGRAPRAVLACAALLAMGQGGAQAPTPSDGAVKVAIVYNISKFVDWPAGQRGGGPLVLCIAGRGERFAEGVAAVEGRPVHGRPFHVQEVARPGELAGCQIALFADPLGPGSAELLAQAHQRGVLTVSDDDAFLAEGGLVELVNRDNHVRFEVNLGSAQKAGFTVSSELLRLAERVVGGGAP